MVKYLICGGVRGEHSQLHRLEAESEIESQKFVEDNIHSMHRLLEGRG